MKNNASILRILKDIRFWIIFSAIIRLYGITNPPLEVAHNWRQTTVTMVARNFYEEEPAIFFPRIDIAGEKSGITGMEFPVFNYLIYLVSMAFGYAHWYGRLINLIVSSLGIFYFHKLIKKYFTPTIALNASLILLFSIWFCYARKIMPDTFSMSFIMMGFYFGSNYLDQKHRFIDLLWYVLLMSVGILSKLTSAYIGTLFILYFFSNTITLRHKIIFSMASMAYAIPVIYWYFFWNPYLVETYGFWHFFMGKGFREASHEIIANLNSTLSKFYDAALKFIGFLLFLFGIIQSIRKKNVLLIQIFLISFLSFAVIIFKSGITFAMHSYYIIPFVPIMALLCGYGIDQIPYKKIAIIILIAICVENTANQLQDFRIKPKDKQLLTLEKELDKCSKRTDLILINSGDYPTPMYFAHRKGWVSSNEAIAKPAYIDSLKSKGLSYIVILKQTFGKDLQMNHTSVFNNEYYTIYKL